MLNFVKNRSPFTLGLLFYVPWWLFCWLTFPSSFGEDVTVDLLFLAFAILGPMLFAALVFIFVLIVGGFGVLLQKVAEDFDKEGK